VSGIEVDMMVELVMEVKVEIVEDVEMEAVVLIGMRNSRSRYR
jgi:hypothetical protein